MAKLFVSNKNESARLFKSDFLELFTHVHWSVPVIIYLPLAAVLIGRAARENALNSPGLLVAALAGVFAWTLVEYLLHRFVFHYQPRSGWGRQLHFLMHGVHHAYPNDAKRLVMPPAVSIPLALLFYGAFTVLLPAAFVAPCFAGFLIGYVCYDEIHYATHHAPMKGTIGLFLKHHHVRHHYLDPERGFGVSSPLWDYVFGTTYSSKDQVTSGSEEGA